jgi:transmembrane sensor
MSHDTGARERETRRTYEAAGEREREARRVYEAAEWLSKMEESNLSPRQQRRFSKWQHSPENRAAFDSLEPTWRILRPPRERVETIPDRPPQPVTTAEQQQQDRIRLVSEEAAYWYFLCVDDPHMMRSHRREFFAWTRRSPEHIAELFKIAMLDGKLRRLRLAMRSLGLSQSKVVELATTGSPHRLHRETEEFPVEKRTLALKLLALSASLFFGLTLAFVARDHVRQDSVVTTGASQWHRMTLADGTTVHIDARSSVEVEYTDAARIVHVRQGSAVFEVAKDARRPFIARTALIDVVAVGTRFGVCIDSGVTTTVSEGIVNVTRRGNVGAKTVTLGAGQELTVPDDSLASPQVTRVDAERKLQWANGLLILGGMTVAEGVEQLNRRNRTQIVVESPALRARVVEFASINVDEPERYARLIAADSDIRMIVDRKHDVIRLSE